MRYNKERLSNALVKFIVIIKQVKKQENLRTKKEKEYIYTYPTVVDNTSTDAWR